jgi:hypothetical protein
MGRFGCEIVEIAAVTSGWLVFGYDDRLCFSSSLHSFNKLTLQTGNVESLQKSYLQNMSAKPVTQHRER